MRLGRTGFCTSPAVALAAMLAIAGAEPAHGQDPSTIVVQLNWTHQAEFAGLYVADKQGFFAAEGLKVSLVEGPPNFDFIAPVVAGRAQFGMAGADALIAARSQGKPVRAIATIQRRSPIVFMSLASSGITKPEQFVGHRIGMTADLMPTLRAMMARLGIDAEQYTVVERPTDLKAFTAGEVPVWGAYLTGLTVALQETGNRFNLIFPDDYGVHFYAGSLYATDDFIAARPQLTARFVRAVLKGWTRAVAKPTEAAELVKSYNPKAEIGRELQRLRASQPLINTGEDKIGWMTREAWAGMYEFLVTQHLVEANLDVDALFTNQFVAEAYQAQP